MRCGPSRITMAGDKHTYMNVNVLEVSRDIIPLYKLSLRQEKVNTESVSGGALFESVDEGLRVLFRATLVT